MQLAAALGLAPGEIVAFVGAGGKTTAMFRLARELRADGASVVVTTTTKIYAPRDDAEIALIVGEDRAAALAAAADALRAGRTPVVGGSVTADGKLTGIPVDWAPHLAATRGSYLLVEADGARQLPITAPREHEPVIPPSTTTLVAVVGVDALEGPIAKVGHHAELIAALAGLAVDDVLDAEAVSRVLLGPRGNTKGAPPGARVVALVNKADTAERVTAARALAVALRRSGAERAVVAALHSDVAVVEVVG